MIIITPLYNIKKCIYFINFNKLNNYITSKYTIRYTALNMSVSYLSVSSQLKQDMLNGKTLPVAIQDISLMVQMYNIKKACTMWFDTGHATE